VGLLRAQKFDLIVLYAVPTYGWQTVILAEMFKVPVLYRALDVSHKIRESMFEKPIEFAEKFIYRRANRLSANNPAMARYCIESGGRTLPSEVNLPPLDARHFKAPTNPSSISRAALDIRPSEKVLMYMGSFFYFSGLVEVIRAFHEQNLKQQDFKLILVGGGEQDQELRELVRDLELENSVIFTGFVDYKVLGEYLALADIFINPMKPDLVSNTAFPHKVLQYMASGRPVVSTKLSGLYETFGDTSGIVWVDEPFQVASAAAALARDEPRMLQNVAIQTETVARVLDMDKCIDSFTSTILRTVGGEPA
jgi:glycosyltransferase involved in cell wall biosynthesis